jgi:hypothetical protein
MTGEEIRQFIMETGEEIQRITERIKQHSTDRMAVSGFRDVVLTTNAFFSVWELEMAHGQNPPSMTADQVDRTVRELVRPLGWAIQTDRIVTVVLAGRIKSRFFLSPAGEAGAA